MPGVAPGTAKWPLLDESEDKAPALPRPLLELGANVVLGYLFR